MSPKATVARHPSMIKNYIIPLLLVVAVLAQGVVAYFSYAAIKEANRIAAMVSRTSEVIAQLENFHSSLAEAESLRRGWFLTGDPSFADAHRDFLAEVQPSLDRLRILTADNPEQQVNIDLLAVAVKARIDHMADLSLTSPRRGEITQAGRELMTAVRARIDRIEDVERSLLRERQMASRKTQADASRLLLLGNLLSVLLVAVAMGTLEVERRRRRTAEEGLRKSEERYRDLVANVPDVSWIADKDSNLLFISPNVQALLGYTVEDVQKKGHRFWIDNIESDSYETRMSAYRELFVDNRPYDLEYRIRHRDGHWVWIHARASLVHSPDGTPLANGLFSDITARKATEQQNEGLRRALEDTNRELARASRMKSQFLASMSHELRTPLNAIVGFSDLLSEESAGALNEKQKRYVEHVRNGAGHLLRLINDILDISKIEAGQMELHFEALDLRDVLPEVLSLVKPLAMQGNVRLEAPEVAGVVRADRVRLKQVLYNLLSNAIKFTPPGGKVSVDSVQKSMLTHISVTDTGIGIAPENQAMIFEEFRQAGLSSRGMQEGTGLGLAITSRIVTLHGGEIRVESEPGKGSCFTFTLPSAEPRDLDSTPPSPGANLAGTRNGEPPLILIVDDETASCELISSYLAPEGYRLMVARSAAEGARLARQHRPDLITLDILMPDGNGFGTLAELKSDRATASIPIVVVSIVDQKKMGISFGAREYLVKPIDRSALVEAVRRQLATAGHNANILVVDDDLPTASMICQELERHGYTCQSVDNGQATIDHLHAAAVDLVILDLMMPEMNGFEVLRRLRSDPKLSETPVIVITAKSLTQDEIETLKRDTKGYIEKTGTWNERLRSEIRRFLEGKA